MGVRRAKHGVGEIAERIWGECTAYRLRVINRAVSRIYDDALRPYRLRIAQLNTLVVVMQTGGLTPNDLSQRMHMDASTVSRNVERMCKSGWLELADIDDARSHEIRITQKGMKLIAVNRNAAARCALVSDPYSAALAREHNDANVIAMGARLIGVDMAKACLQAFLAGEFGGERHVRRVEKLSKLPQDA